MSVSPAIPSTLSFDPFLTLPFPWHLKASTSSLILRLWFNPNSHEKNHSNHLPWIEMEHVVTDLSFPEQSGSSTPSQPLQRGNGWGRAGEEAPPTREQQYSLTDWVWAHEPMSQKQNGRSKSVMHRKLHTILPRKKPSSYIHTVTVLLSSQPKDIHICHPAT